MLRKLIIAAWVVATAAASTSHALAAVDEGNYEEHVMPTNDDRLVPWPWSLARPIPWSDIQGLWKVEQDDFTSYFAFKVVRHKQTGIRQLQVKQFDGDSCRVLANGVGIETNRKILAQMTSKGGTIYRVELTSFNEKDSPVPQLRGNIPVDGVMVLSMSTFENPNPENKFHMQIMKISSFVTQKFCFEDVRK